MKLNHTHTRKTETNTANALQFICRPIHYVCYVNFRVCIFLSPTFFLKSLGLRMVLTLNVTCAVCYSRALYACEFSRLFCVNTWHWPAGNFLVNPDERVPDGMYCSRKTPAHLVYGNRTTPSTLPQQNQRFYFACFWIFSLFFPGWFHFLSFFIVWLRLQDLKW